MTHHHLVQLNVAKMRAPLESPVMAEFVSRLEDINRIADEAPGFVWRLTTDAGDATGFRPIGADMLVNLSVWASPEALADFVFRSPHAAVMRKRREWFHRLADAYLVLWWVAAGHRPTLEEAIERLEELRRLGPTPRAFTFATLFGPDATRRSAGQPPAEFCPAL